MEHLKEFVITLTTITIFITAVELVLPDNSLKKYQNFVLSLIMLVVILSPIIKIFNSEVSVINEIDKAVNELKLDINKESFYSKSNAQNLISKGIEENTKSILDEKFELYDFDVSMDAKFDLDKYDVKINSVVVKYKESSDEKRVVEKIEIGNGGQEDVSEIALQIKELLSKELNIDQKNIKVIKGE